MLFHRPLLRRLALLCSVILGFAGINSCTVTTETYYITEYTPIYMSWDEMRKGVSVEGPRSLDNAGKIWVSGDMLFINEQAKGIHVIDNSDRSAPAALAFIAIPGNVDVAVKQNFLYADSFTDLLSFDISDPANPRLVQRVNNVFRYQDYQHGVYLDSSRGVAADWKTRSYTRKRSVSSGDDVVFSSNESSPQSRSSDAGGINQGGSMARLTLAGDFMYYVDDMTLYVMSLSNPAQPQPVASFHAGFAIETIYPYKARLFLGSQGGMFVYDISNPAAPRYVSEFQHMLACDPVVVNDDYAFITLRSGTDCRGFGDELNIVDISNITAPQLLEVYPLSNPHGLALSGDLLYICDGSDGFKVYEASDIHNLNLLSHIRNLNSFDVIPLGAGVIISGRDGLYQYDCSDPRNCRFLSRIGSTPN